jgi:hypothetical protein
VIAAVDALDDLGVGRARRRRVVQKLQQTAA